jgi:alpha-amylase
VLSAYIDYMNGRLSMFDIPLLESFYRVSCGVEPDMRKVFDGSLVSIKPDNTVVSARILISRRGKY